MSPLPHPAPQRFNRSSLNQALNSESFDSTFTKRRNCLAYLAYASQGLTRYCAVNTDWYDDLVDLLVEFIAGHENRFEELATNEAVNLHALFQELAIEIANDGRFVQARGLRKKGLLVEAVWGDRIPLDAQSRLARLVQGEELQGWIFAHVVRHVSDIVDQRKMLE